MGTITNKTPKPLSVPLPEGKTLRLGPRASAELSAKAAQHAAVLKLVEAGTIEVVDGPTKPAAGQRASGGHGTNRGR